MIDDHDYRWNSTRFMGFRNFSTISDARRKLLVLDPRSYLDRIIYDLVTPMMAEAVATSMTLLISVRRCDRYSMLVERPRAALCIRMNVSRG